MPSPRTPIRHARGAERLPVRAPANLRGVLRTRAPVKAVSNHDQIVRVLGEEIVAGVHAPGGNLPAEADLLRRFGVSRTVLREVLKTLGAKGMVVAKTRVGTRVLDARHWNFFDPDVIAWKVARSTDGSFRASVAEIRRALEPAAAALAAGRRSDADVKAMRAEIAAMRVATSSDAYAEADLRFHLVVGAASGNPMMRSMASVIEAALMDAFTMSPPVRRVELHRETTDAHELIVDAIEARDAQKAAHAMLAVIDAGFNRVQLETRSDKRRRKS